MWTPNLSIRGCIIQYFCYHMHIDLNFKNWICNIQFYNSIYQSIASCLHSRWKHVCFVFSPDPKTDNSLFRSWWSLTNIMQVISSSTGTTSEPWDDPSGLHCPVSKDWVSNANYVVSRWPISNLRPPVTSFRVDMCFKLTTNRPTYR